MSGQEKIRRLKKAIFAGCIAAILLVAGIFTFIGPSGATAPTSKNEYKMDPSEAPSEQASDAASIIVGHTWRPVDLSKCVVPWGFYPNGNTNGIVDITYFFGADGMILMHFEKSPPDPNSSDQQLGYSIDGSNITVRWPTWGIQTDTIEDLTETSFTAFYDGERCRLQRAD